MAHLGSWSPPPKGWLKINTDSAYKSGKAAIGMIVCDARGRHQFSAAKVTENGLARRA